MVLDQAGTPVQLMMVLRSVPMASTQLRRLQRTKCDLFFIVLHQGHVSKQESSESSERSQEAGQQTERAKKMAKVQEHVADASDQGGDFG